MGTVIQTLVALGAVAFFVWLCIPTATPTAPSSGRPEDPFIDPDDSQQIGMLVGMTGGSVPDAALLRFALQRFQQIHRRRATTRDIGVVLGLIQAGK